MAKVTNIAKRRKLSELFERGTEVRFNADGVNTGEPTPDDITVFVRPPNPFERDMALREAAACRARAVLAARRRPDEDADSITSIAAISNLSTDDLIDYLITQKEGDTLAEGQRRVLAEEEWKDFDQLRDSVRQWSEAGYPEDDHWLPIIERDNEFGRQVRAAADAVRDAAREAYRLVSREKLEEQAFEKRIDVLGNQAFMKAYQENMLFYACKDEDKKTQFFETVQEILEAPEEVQEALANTLSSFLNSPGDAKNSQRAAPSSDSAEPSANQEISEPSGQETVSA